MYSTTLFLSVLLIKEIILTRLSPPRPYCISFCLSLQEIDGQSLLLMKRSDVLTGLSIKLGPALKIYQHVIKLQTAGLENSLFFWIFVIHVMINTLPFINNSPTGSDYNHHIKFHSRNWSFCSILMWYLNWIIRMYAQMY